MENYEITDDMLREFANKAKQEKGINTDADRLVFDKKEFVKNINLLLCHMETPQDLRDVLVGLKIFLGRMGIVNDCFATVNFDTWRVHIEMYEE